MLLCGAATAAAGPIAFVGLTVPHVARAICGPDYRWILPWSMVLAPTLLLGADVIGRVVARPGEIQVGIVTAIIGAPFFIALVRRRHLVGVVRRLDDDVRPRRRSAATGDRMVVDRTRARSVSPTRVHVRAVVVTTLLGAAAFGVFMWSLTVGDFPIALSDVAATLRGNGSSEHEFIIRTLRLPRGLTGLAVGAAFGLSGAIFQRLANNQLASPDIIGVNAGAAVAAVFAIVVVHASGPAVTAAALVGAAVTAIATYLLAYRRGVTGYRLILVGIGVAAVLNAFVQYLLTRAEIYDAQQAVVWLTGSLNGRTWDDLRPIADHPRRRRHRSSSSSPASCAPSSSATMPPAASASASSARVRCCSSPASPSPRWPRRRPARSGSSP